MKLLYVALARSIWLFDIGLLNPEGKPLQPLIEKLAEKYRFATSPRHQLDLNEQKALEFKAGTFINSKKRPVLVSLAIYNDGIVADTFSSTNDSTEFLTQLSGWIKGEFGLAVPADVRTGYVSQIDVECSLPLSALNATLTEFRRVIDAAFRPLDGKAREFDVGGISFWTEDVTMPLAPAIFKFERKWKAPFASNHYFSQGPFETPTHLAVLEDLERLLM